MLFRTHLAFAMLACLVFVYYFDMPSPLLFGVIFVFSAALPDIDTGKSVIGKKLRPLSSFINLFLGHRGFVHAVWLPAVLFGLLYWKGFPLLGLAAFLGYCSHLACDMLSLEGIRPFYPVFSFRVRGFFRTGGIGENFVLLAAWIGIGFMAVRLFGIA